MGSAKRIERVYFEIQWVQPNPVGEAPGQGIQRQFIFDVVNEGGEEKMELFVNSLEDTIFEMQAERLRYQSQIWMRGQRTKRRVRRRSRRSRVRGWVSFPSWRSSPPCLPSGTISWPLCGCSAWKAWRSRWRGEEDDSEGHDHSLLYILLEYFDEPPALCSQRFQRLLCASSAASCWGGSLVEGARRSKWRSSWPTCRLRKMRFEGDGEGGGEENPGRGPALWRSDGLEGTDRGEWPAFRYLWLGPEARRGAVQTDSSQSQCWVTSWATPSLSQRCKKVPGNLPPVTAALWTSGGHDRWDLTSAVLLVPEWCSVDDLTFQKVMVFQKAEPASLLKVLYKLFHWTMKGTNSGTHSQDIRQLINNHSIHKYFIRIGHVSSPPGYHTELKEM